VKTLIAVIALNEEANIGATLDDLKARPVGYDIAVIDNGSTDRTVAICRERGVRVISHCVHSGGAMGTVNTYFELAFQENYDCLCQFDGDGQHIASELPKICEPILSDRADYVIGSRFIEKQGFQSTATRRLGIRLFSQLDSLIMGQRVTDVTSGFRAYSRRVIEFFALKYRIELQDMNQLLLASHFSGARVLEVPVMMRPRIHGESEYDLLQSLSYPLFGAMNILGAWLQYRRLRTANH
jgi:glycosyltransferase involved in cell wall biosynthesis